MLADCSVPDSGCLGRWGIGGCLVVPPLKGGQPNNKPTNHRNIAIACARRWSLKVSSGNSQVRNTQSMETHTQPERLLSFPKETGVDTRV